MAAAARRHADAIGYDAFRVPGLLLEAWVAERQRGRGGSGGGIPAARSSSRGAHGFADHAAFALAGLGSTALASGDLQQAEELERQALATGRGRQRAVGGGAGPRPARRARAAAAGDAETALRLYREVLDWSQAQRPHRPREGLFVALAGSPEAAAVLGLAEIAEPARKRGGAGPAAELAEGPARLAERWHRRPRAFALSKTDEQEARYEHNHD